MAETETYMCKTWRKDDEYVTVQSPTTGTRITVYRSYVGSFPLPERALVMWVFIRTIRAERAKSDEIEMTKQELTMFYNIYQKVLNLGQRHFDASQSAEDIVNDIIRSGNLYKMKRLTQHQIRFSNKGKAVIDIYPKRGKYHIIPTGKRGLLKQELFEQIKSIIKNGK